MKNRIILLALADAGYAANNAWKAVQEEGSEARSIKALPPSVQHTVAQMDSSSQRAFFNEQIAREALSTLAIGNQFKNPGPSA